jgi:hypothetical protein
LKIAVKDLRPNPFRHVERYPVDRAKVDALKQSIEDTTFWDNLICRKALNGSGGYELAYGEHRRSALLEMKREFVDIPVRDLDDTAMAKIMAHENMEEWSWSASIEQETVRAIIEGFAEGRIQMPKEQNNRETVRIAPSFVPKSRSGVNPDVRIYSAATLAKFLGWKESKVEATLNALAVIEKGLADDDQFAGLTAYQAEAVAKQVRRVEKETGKPALAKKIGKTLASGMRSATGQRPGRGGKQEFYQQPVTLHTARQVTNQLMAKEKRPVQKEPPLASEFIPQLATKIDDLFSPDVVKKVHQVIDARRDVHKHDLRLLVVALRGIAKRATALANKLEDF